MVSSVLRSTLTSVTLCIVAIILSGPMLIGQTGIFEVEVLSVIEGDRLEVLHDGVVVLNVRLAGIDTPNLNHNLCYAEEARDYVSLRLLGRPVYIEVITTGGPGPTTYNLYLDSFGTQNFNATLVDQGIAITHTTRYDREQINARSNQRGLWGECLNTNPRLVIKNVDFSGDDQVVSIQNVSNEHVDVTGWRLASSPWEELSEWCICPDELIAPNQIIRVHSGPAASANTPDDIVCGAVNIWRAARDSAWLIDNNGRIESLYEYLGGYRDVN